MGRSQETYNKKEREKKRLKKQEEKRKKKEEKRETGSKVSGMEDMIAYVDEFGNLTDTPPDLTQRKKINAKSIEIGVPKREKEEVPAVREGIADFFNHDKGFGFIREIGSGEKYFVHVNGLEVDSIDEGNKVSYEIEQGMKGWNAVKVKKI